MPDGKGFNGKTRQYEDLIKHGICDPVKVERCAVENAVSLAANFLTSHASVSLVRSEGKDKQE
jgi:chaperonin GroEL